MGKPKKFKDSGCILLIINLLAGVCSKHRQLARQVGAFARSKPGLGWLTTTSVGSLDFILTMEGELVWVQTTIQSLPSIILDQKRYGR